LNLDNDLIGNTGAALAKTLESNLFLTSLNPGETLAKALESNSSLTSLNLNMDRIEDNLFYRNRSLKLQSD